MKKILCNARLKLTGSQIELLCALRFDLCGLCVKDTWHMYARFLSLQSKIVNYLSLYTDTRRKDLCDAR